MCVVVKQICVISFLQDWRPRIESFFFWTSTDRATSSPSLLHAHHTKQCHEICLSRRRRIHFPLRTQKSYPHRLILLALCPAHPPETYKYWYETIRDGSQSPNHRLCPNTFIRRGYPGWKFLTHRTSDIPWPVQGQQQLTLVFLTRKITLPTSCMSQPIGSVILLYIWTVV